MSNLRKNILSHAASTAVGSVVQLLLIIFLANTLEKTNFGNFVFIVALISIMEIISDFGLRISILKEYASNTFNQYSLFSYAILGKLIISFIAFLGLILLFSNRLPIEQILLITLISSTQPSSDPILWWLRSEERLDIEGAIVIAWRVLNTALIIISVSFFDIDILIILIIWLFSNLLRLYCEKEYLQRKLPQAQKFITLKFNQFTFFSSFSLLKLSMPIGISLIVMAVYIRLNTFVIDYYGNASDVALYGAAFTIAVSSGFIATSITTSIFPRILKAINEKNKHQLILYVKKSLSLITIIFGIGGLVGIFITPYLISIVYGNSFKESSKIMILLLPGLYISSINFSLKYYLNAINLVKQELYSIFLGISSLFSIFYLFYLGSIFPIYISAALAWSLSELNMFLYKCLTLIKHKKNSHMKVSSFYIYLLTFAVLFFLSLAQYIRRL